MQSEYQILAILARTDRTSQRQIATGTGLSVGTVNLLLKKMVRKGLVKLERVNGRTLRYVLTPQGMAEKTRLAYQYLKVSYRRIVRVSQALERAVARQALLTGTPPRLVFYGPPDEILEMLKLAAASLNLPYIVVSPGGFTADDPARKQAGGGTGRRLTGDCLVITWDGADAEAVPAEIPRVNILDVL